MALDPQSLAILARQFQAHASGLRHFHDEFDKFLDRFADLNLDPDELCPETLAIARDLLVDNRHLWESYRDQLLTLSERMAEIEAANPIMITEAELARLQSKPESVSPAVPQSRAQGLPEIDTRRGIKAASPPAISNAAIAWVSALLATVLVLCWLLG